MKRHEIPAKFKVGDEVMCCCDNGKSCGIYGIVKIIGKKYIRLTSGNDVVIHHARKLTKLDKALK